MAERTLLPVKDVAPGALSRMAQFQRDAVDEVASAIARHAVVVVGMAQNVPVRRVRKALSDAEIAFEYLEYGSYVSQWRKRLAIKLWSGWPTFPQVFVRGLLIGGEDLTKAAIADGSLKARLSATLAT
jgi:monothiol glutaredoxin